MKPLAAVFHLRNRLRLFMRFPVFLFIIAQPVFAQVPAPATPRPPFAGFGNALDKRPPSERQARTPSAVPQLPRATSKLSFDARSVSTGGGASLNRTDSKIPGPGKTQTRNSRVVLELKVRNFSAEPASGQFEWFFVADAVGKGPNYIWDKGSRAVTLEPGVEQKELLESQELVETTNRTVQSNRVTEGGRTYTQYNTVTTKAGARPQGWIVRLFSEGKLVRVQASSPELERMGYDNGVLSAMQAAAVQTPRPGFPPGFPPNVPIPGIPQQIKP